MKKFIAIFFLFFYSVTNVGAAVHFHYCNGKLLTVSLSSADKKNNGCGSSHTHAAKDNCKDKHVDLKQSNDQDISANDFWFKTAFSSIAALPTFSSYDAPVSFNLSTSYPSVNAPPVVHKLRLHVLNRVFLI